MRDADLVLYVRGFQPALERAVDSTSDRPSTSCCRRHGRVDPHVWLDPVRFAAIVERIGKELGRRPEAEPFAARLRALDREFRRGLARCERREIVTSHAAFGYLAARYGLRQIAITGISPEAEPTPRDLEDVVRQVRAAGATTVFIETARLAAARRDGRTGGRRADRGARPDRGPDRGAGCAGEDYFSVMRDNLAALRKALGCR